VRDKEQALETLVGTGGHHTKINSMLKGKTSSQRKIPRKNELIFLYTLLII